jgi:hypothetical protein
MPLLAVEAVKRVDTTVGVLTIIFWVAIGGSAAGAWWQRLPWQLPVFAFVAFLGYGFLRAVYQEYLVVEGERDRLRKGKTTNEKRMELKELLAMADEGGERLHAADPSMDDAREWVTRTHNLIEASLGKGEARLFLSDYGYTFMVGQNDTK